MTNMIHDEEYIELKRRFDLYYNEKLLPVLQENDNIRRRYFSAFILLVFMGIFFYPLILYALFRINLDENDAFIGIILGLSCLVIMLLCGPLYMYKKKVKPHIMPDFANFFGSFVYRHEGKINDMIIQQSGLFGKYNKSSGDDAFTGIYDGVRISIAEEKLQMLKKDFNNFEVSKNIFRGICILFEMSKNFKGKTIVLKDRKFLNIFNHIAGLQNVKLEDINFEKYFEVYSDDQIEARYLLTSGFMERIIRLRDLYNGSSIQLSFNCNTLLLAIPTKQNMFEANSFFRSNINKNKIDMVFEQFYTVCSIVKLLKLNQKIGM